MYLSRCGLALTSSPFLAWLVYVVKCHLSRRRGYPPGPPKKPVIGNILDMPRSRRCLTYSKWGQLYGPLTFVEVVGQPILIINSYDAAVALLDKKGGIYSDRPRFHMGELVGVDGSSVLMGFGPTWARHRKFLRQALNARTVSQEYTPLQEAKTYQLVRTILNDPNDFMNHVRKTTSEIVTEIAYGAHRDEKYDFIDLNDQLSEIIHKVLTQYVVDLLPWLKCLPAWFPGLQFKRDACKWRKQYLHTRQYLYNSVKSQKSNVSAPPSYVLHMLQELENPSQTDEEIISASAFTLYRAGNDTTQASIKTFILAMSLHPHIQAKVQAEVDSVLGDRIPTLEDMESLPYLTAVVLESFRWNPPVPTGVPHRLTVDDCYNGYAIPANTTIVVNIWNITRDPLLYDDPSTFNPLRFFQNDTPALDPREYVFGFGRRLCPGNDLAYRTIWLSAATMMWAFDINRSACSSLLAEDHVDLDLVSNPTPFNCNFTPRHENLDSVLSQALAMF